MTDEELTTEARQVLRQQVSRLRQMSHTELSSYIGKPEAFEVTAPSGRVFQIEVTAFWDDKRKRNLRVLVAMDDGKGWRMRDFLSDDFILSPDGSFVGE